MCSGSRSLDLQQMVEQRGHLIKTQTHTHRRTTTKSCAGESDGLWCTSEWIKQITLKAEQFILMKTLSYNSAAITQRFAHSASGHNHGVWFWREDVSISMERCANACRWSVTCNKVKYDHKTWCCVWYTFFFLNHVCGAPGFSVEEKLDWATEWNDVRCVYFGYWLKPI